MPNAVLAITSIANAPQNLITETIFNIYLNKICYSKNVYWRMHTCVGIHMHAYIMSPLVSKACIQLDYTHLVRSYTTSQQSVVPIRLLTLSN